MRKVIFFLLGFALLLSMVFFLGTKDVAAHISAISPHSLAILFSLQLSTLMASAWLWHFLLSRKSNVSFSSVFLINQAAGMVESITPSVKFGGEAAKIWLFRKYTGQKYEDLSGAMLVHKFLTMAPFAVLCLLLLAPAAYYFTLPAYFYALLALLFLFCGLLGATCYRKPASPWKNSDNIHEQEVQGKMGFKVLVKARTIFIGIFAFLRQARSSASTLLGPGQSIAALSVSLIIWIFYPVKVYLVCMFLGIDVHPIIIGLSTLFAYMVSMVPVLPGGLGAYEGGMAAFFTIGGLSPAEGLAIALVSRLTTFWFPLLVSAVSCIILLKKRELLTFKPAESSLMVRISRQETG